MTDFHYFAVPTATDPGTLNPVYELLDFPIAMGRAEDVVLTGPAPEKPLVDGREVTDPRLIKALSVPVELDRNGQGLDQAGIGDFTTVDQRFLRCRTGQHDVLGPAHGDREVEEFVHRVERAGIGRGRNREVVEISQRRPSLRRHGR